MILDYFQKINIKQADIKQLQDDIKETEDVLTPVTNQNVSGSISNDLLKLVKEHYELQQYSRNDNVEMLGLLDIVTGDRLMGKIIESCNDVGVMVEVKDIKACHGLF